MSDNLDKLKGHSDVKQDLNRRGSGEDINGKHSIKLNKRLNDIKKVISDPDLWNVNIASRERMDELEKVVGELERRIEGMAYIMRSIAFNRRLKDEDIQAIDKRVDDDSNISGSGS